MNEAATIRTLQDYLERGNEACNKLRYQEAERIYRKALKLAPHHPQILWNLGVLVQRRADNPEERLEAMNFYHDVIKYSEGDSKATSNAFTNMGVVMLKINRLEEAEVCFGFAKNLNPENNAARINFADILRHKGEYSEASQEFLEVLRLDPDSAAAKFSTGMIALLLGDLKRGFALYESRFDVDSFPTKKFKSDKPEWNLIATETKRGDLTIIDYTLLDLNGKTILLNSEQGLGDDLMFIRYVREIKRRWTKAKVWFRGGILLQNIFKGVRELDLFIPGGEVPLGLYDYHCHMISLPHLMGTTLETIPSEAPYISPVEGWPKYELPTGELDATPRHHRRIGICWAGSPRHGKDAFRSLPPESFQPMIDAHPEMQFYSLQVGPKADECARLTNLIDLAPTITDFTDTTQAILQLDLVVSVDTAIVHLCGALDKPCWMVTPMSPDWRWLLEREDSPWYPKMRLFRQEKTGEWESVLKRISEAL